MNIYWAYRGIEFFSRILPLRFAYWVGLRVADLFYFALPAPRSAVERNLATIYAARDIQPSAGHLRAMVRKTYQYFGKYLVDFFRSARLDPETIGRRVSFQHRHYLDEARALDRGVILVSAHFGNWELGGAALAGLGFEIHVVVLPERLKKLERLLQRYRELRGFRVLPVGQAARSLLRCLHAKGIVALLADRTLGGRAATCQFFGRPTTLPAGPALLAHQTGAPLLPVFITRQEDDTFLFHFHPPIVREREGTVAAMQEALAQCLQSEIAERPHQWFIFTDFWAGEGRRTQS